MHVQYFNLNFFAAVVVINFKVKEWKSSFWVYYNQFLPSYSVYHRL